MLARTGSPLTPSPSDSDTTPPVDQTEPGPWRIAAWGLASTLVATALSSVFQILVARFMAPRSYSETIALLSLYMLGSMPLAPIFLLVTRRVVEARLGRSEADIATLLVTLTRYIGLASLLGVALAFVARTSLAHWLHVNEVAAPQLFAVSLAVNALFLLVLAVLFGRLNWPMANALQVLQPALRIAFSVIFVRAGFEVAGTFAAIAASTTLCVAIGFVAALRGLPRGGHYRPLHIAEVSLAITVNLAFWFVVQLDTIYVNRALPDVAEPYVAASALGKMLVYIPIAISNVLFPLLAAARSPAAGRALVLKMLLLAVLLDIVGYAIIAAAPEQVVLITLGRTHLAAAPLLVTVAAVLAPFALAGVFMYDALARRDWTLTGIFAVAAVFVAAAVKLTAPSLPMLFTILLTGAGITIIGGFVRSMTRGYAGRGSRSNPGDQRIPSPTLSSPE